MIRLLNSKGQGLVVLALTVVSITVFTGVSIDFGNVFAKKLGLQAAVDAGAISGITSLVEQASQEDTEPDNAIQTAEENAIEMTAFNIQEKGLATGSFNDLRAMVEADAQINDATKELVLEVSSEITVNTLFLRIFGLLSMQVSASGTARRNPVLISLVLDRSGSMEGEKMAAMKEAAKNFVNSFTENLDQIAVVSFNFQAEIIHPMGVLSNSGANSKAAIGAAIDTLIAQGDTNIADGIAQGRIAIENVVNGDPAGSKEAVKAIVLFTDGSPTAIRGDFLNPKPELSQNPPGSGKYIYFVETDKDGDLLRNEAGIVQVCGASTTIASCLQDYSYLDSRGTNQGFDAAGNLITNLSNAGQSEIEREDYDLAIIEANYAKDFRNAADPNDKGIFIYTIGLGVLSNVTNEPYQDVDDRGKLKPFLLRKLANVQEASGDPTFPGQIGFDSSQPEGMFRTTVVPGDLDQIFRDIARAILLKLVE